MLVSNLDARHDEQIRSGGTLMCVCAGTARSICILAVFAKSSITAILAVFAKSSITATSAHIRLSFSIHGLSVNENQKKKSLATPWQPPTTLASQELL